MKLTRKPPILFRFARHSGPLGKQRGKRSQRNIVPGRPKCTLVQKMNGVVGVTPDAANKKAVGDGGGRVPLPPAPLPGSTGPSWAKRKTKNKNRGGKTKVLRVFPLWEEMWVGTRKPEIIKQYQWWKADKPSAIQPVA